jgi:hypothetical protein
MHVLALILGAWLHLAGDVILCFVSFVIASGMNGYVYEEYYEFPSRRAAAFELLPVPVGLALAGLILARWGYVGM